MSHIHRVERQNKLEMTRDKDEVNIGQQGRNPRIRWSGTRSRHDGRSTDTHDGRSTESGRPRQGSADHCLMSRRRRCAEEVAMASGHGTCTVARAAFFRAFFDHQKRKEWPLINKTNKQIQHWCPFLFKLGSGHETVSLPDGGRLQDNWRVRGQLILRKELRRVLCGRLNPST